MARPALPSLLLMAVLVRAPLGVFAVRLQAQPPDPDPALSRSAHGNPKPLRCIARSGVAAGRGKASPAQLASRHREATPSECSRWPLAGLAGRYTGTGALPLNRTWWSGSVAKLYLPDRSDFERALEPAGYSGARLRLRRFMLKLLAGRSVEVAVLGGSMTKGRESDASWPQLFEEHMRSLGHHITVHNLAKPSAGSEYAANNIVYQSEELNRSSLVIIDTAINDDKDWLFDPGTGRDTYDFLAQGLLELSRRPAVLDLATRHWGWGTSARVYCSSNLSDFTHARAKAFELPILSFPDAMCRCCGSEGLWFGNQHPNATTHDAIARTLVGAIGVEMERTCAPGGLLVPDHPPSSAALQTASFAQCLRSRSSTSVDFTLFNRAESGQPFVKVEGPKKHHSHGTWRFARDLPTKPFGWMVPSGAPSGGVISFKVKASKGGWIRLDYLSTYEDIGAVKCWVDGVEEHQWGCYINARLVGDFSVVRSAYIGLPTDLGAELLHCRSGGGKFKVLGIGSC